MHVETLPIAALIPAGYNPRRMSKHDAESLKRSLAEYGAVEPAVVNADNTIIGGHMRVQAAQQLGWTEFPVVRVDLPDDKAKLLNLALNRIHGEWDEALLEELIYGLHQSDADLALSGFDSEEIDRLLDAVSANGTEQLAGIDTVPSKYMVLVECSDESAQSDLLARLIEEGWTCRALLS